MATYKKRGGKPRTKADKQAEIEDNSATAEVFNTLDEGASKTEAWVEKNQNIILGVVGVIAVAVLGYFAYNQFVLEPKQGEAANEMYQAQSYFDKAITASAEESDSIYNLALTGGAGKYGFVDIADKYSGTNAGNMANYYAGLAYLHTKRYQEAINYLDDFKGADEMTGAIAKGAIGDAFVQLNQNDEALKYYEEAATMRSNDVTTPRFLLKAGVTAMNLGKTDIALNHFTKITDEYTTSPEAKKAEVYKGMTQAMKK